MHGCFHFFGAQSTREVMGVFSDETRPPSVSFHLYLKNFSV